MQVVVSQIDDRGLVLSCSLKLDSAHQCFTRPELKRHIKIKHSVPIDR